MTDLSAGPEIWAHKVNEPDTSGQYPDPEAIRQKRIAELERRLDDLLQANAPEHMIDDCTADLRKSRLRNEQPKGGDDRPKLRLEDDAQGKRAMLGGYQMPNELIPSLEAEAPSPLPGPQDVRERFARSLYFAAEGLGWESWFLPENDAHWERWKKEGQDGIAPSPLAIADALIAAFPALAQSQPVRDRVQRMVTHCCVPEIDEPFFVLLGRDPQAPGLVEQWATDRKQAEPEAVDKWASAAHTACDMRNWKMAHPERGMAMEAFAKIAPPRPDASGLTEAAVLERYAQSIAMWMDRENVTDQERLSYIKGHPVTTKFRTRAADRSAPRSDRGGA